MKKKYVKPELYFENFELSTSIAAVCGKGIGHSENNCSYKIAGGETIFVTPNNCSVDGYTQDKDLYCYHNPDDKNRLFAS